MNAASHPEIIRRQDDMMRGIHDMMRQIVPDPPPPFPALSDDYLDDLVNLHGR